MLIDQMDNETECYSLATTPSPAKVLHTVVLGVIMTASLLANGMVLLLVSRYKRLRCRSVMVSLSVVAVDILMTFTYTLPVLITAALQRWAFQSGGCIVFGATAFQFLMTRWLIMAVLCVDRFNTVRFPFSYEKYSKPIMIVLTVLAWLIPVLFSIPTLSKSGFGPVKLRENLPTCLITCDSSKGGRGCQVFYLLYFTLVFLLGSAVPISLYSWLYYRARRLRPTMLVLGQVTTRVASGAVVRQPVAEYQLPRREWRALATFALILLTVLVTGIPAYLLQVVRVVNLEFHCRISIYVHYIIIEILLSASALDPFVIMRTKDFRTCIKLLFCRRMAHTEDISSREPSNHLPALSKSPSKHSEGAQEDPFVTMGNGAPMSHNTLPHSPRTSVS